ncbi:family 43 glycosylhydrolase [Agromyces aureus]|nr:family 43 glycosylhydrolase [Agromyces aureus]
MPSSVFHDRTREPRPRGATRRRAAAASVVVGAVVASTLLAGPPALAADAPPQPIASYAFDDGTLQDSVGAAHLTASGTAAVATDAERGKVLRLDGTTNGFAAFPRGFFDGRSNMTVSLDVKSEKASGNFFTFAFGADSNKYSFFRLRGADVRTAITQTSWQNESAVTGTVASGAWHHYDLVFDGAKMTVYVDGAKLGENAALNTTVSDLGTNLYGYLGKSLYAADEYFKGSFDDVQVFDRALSASEVLTNAGATDQLTEVSLADPALLKLAPIVNGTARTAILPVRPGTDVSALAPTFVAAAGVTVSPASGSTVDLRSPVVYTLTAPDGATSTWTLSAQAVNSPVLPGLYADPNIAVFGDTYYLYATTDGTAGWGGKDFYVWKSADLVNWTRSEQPFLTLDGAAGNVPWATGNAWAPTIIERDGRYFFYFSGHNASLNRKTIGVAVADSPEGPFTAQPTAMILNNEAVTSGQAIDPAAFHDPVTGRYYLYWGNGSPVFAELSDTMTSLKSGTISAMSGLTSYREGSFMNYRDGIYHLTYAIDDTGSENYRVGYATSTSATGPWTYRGVILQKDLSLGIKGTGHSSIINVPGTDDWYIAYHRFAMPNGDGTHRETTIDKLTIGADGLFQTVQPTLTSVAPHPIRGQVEVSAVATTRCVAGKAVLAVTATNESDEPVAVAIETPYGSKQVAALAAGASTSASFASRLVALPAGTTTVTATGAGPSATDSVSAGYAARSCG